MTIEITSKTVCNIITVKDRRKLKAKLNKREIKSYVKGFQKKGNADSEQTCRTGIYIRANAMQTAWRLIKAHAVNTKVVGTQCQLSLKLLALGSCYAGR